MIVRDQEGNAVGESSFNKFFLDHRRHGLVYWGRKYALDHELTLVIWCGECGFQLHSKDV